MPFQLSWNQIKLEISDLLSQEQMSGRLHIFHQCLLETDSFSHHSVKCWVVFTWLVVPYAVVWWVLKVHQVILAGSLEVCVRGSEPSAVLVNGHLHGAVIPLTKMVASAPEVGHGQPTGPNAARPADAVTLTLQSHEALYCLARREGENRKWVSKKIVCVRIVFKWSWFSPIFT